MLMFRAAKIPVGKDQLSRVESARELARAINFLLEPTMEKRAQNEKRTDEVSDMLRERTLKAKRTAEENMEEMKREGWSFPYVQIPCVC